MSCMNERPELRHVIAQWVSKAEEDLTAAEYLLTMGGQCPFATVCFHAQQLVEKYLKALLSQKRRPVAASGRRRKTSVPS
jgi:HEPN domain-containing protein